MKYIFPILLFFGCSKTENINVNLIPKPQEIKINDGYFTLGFGTKTISDSVFYEELNYLNSLFPLPLNGKKNTIKLEYVEGFEEEEFLLLSTKDSLKISASNNAGIMRGIQTLRQLLPNNYEDKGLVAKIPCIEIKDYPRFKWRYDV